MRIRTRKRPPCSRVPSVPTAAWRAWRVASSRSRAGRRPAPQRTTDGGACFPRRDDAPVPRPLRVRGNRRRSIAGRARPGPHGCPSRASRGSTRGGSAGRRGPLGPRRLRPSRRTARAPGEASAPGRSVGSRSPSTGHRRIPARRTEHRGSPQPGTSLRSPPSRYSSPPGRESGTFRTSWTCSYPADLNSSTMFRPATGYPCSGAGSSARIERGTSNPQVAGSNPARRALPGAHCEVSRHRSHLSRSVG